MHFGRRLLSLLLCFIVLAVAVPAMADREEEVALFDAAAGTLKTPAQVGQESGTYGIHTGTQAYVPDVDPGIIPYDEQGQSVNAIVATGSFESSDENVVTVDGNGLMTGVSQGTATVTYHADAGDIAYEVTVGDDIPPELAKNMAYVARREFYKNKRARLPKYNEYAKWYYGKKNEVGWCAVFAIWCANASGNNPLKKANAKEVTDEEMLYMREGAVGNQYDGFFYLDRFVDVPREGYTVIYADMSNGYRTTHIGIVVEAIDKGDGIYQITTVEGNMSNTVKSYCYLYDSHKANNTVGTEKGRKLQWNMSEVPQEDRDDALVQYALHTDHWSVFGFGQSWK